MSYGLLPPKDVKNIERTLDLVCEQFPEGVINTCEIGVHKGHTSRGIHKYLTDKWRINFHTGIDNQHDLPIEVPFPGCNLILEDSREAWEHLAKNSQHFIFIDGNHSYVMTMADFGIYKLRVAIGGYIALHDTGKHIKPFTDYQGVGSKDDPNHYIACRKAIDTLGLLDNKVDGWELVFDEADESFHTGGLTVVKRIK